MEHHFINGMGMPKLWSDTDNKLFQEDGRVQGGEVIAKMRPQDWARLNKVAMIHFADKRKLRKEYYSLMERTEIMEEHPDEYDGPCLCKLCRSYG